MKSTVEFIMDILTRDINQYLMLKHSMLYLKEFTSYLEPTWQWI